MISTVSLDLLERLWPSAPARLREAIVDQLPDVALRRGLSTRLRLVHFLAQVSHESDGGTVTRESMRYSAARIMEIFGIGHHSAGVTRAEAERLAADAKRTGGVALAERVYGLGNPKMAADLGNTEPGDGWAFRGGGLTQTTGRAAYALAARRSGLPLLDHPDLIADPDHALDIAAADFGDCSRAGKTCLEWADLDDVVMVTKALNGGTNGLSSRREWLARWKRALPEAAPAVDAATPIADATPTTAATATAEPTIEYGDTGWQVEAVQRRLAALGYPIGRIDGRFGDATRAAVLDLQARSGLATDGVVGPATRRALDTAPPREVSAARAAATVADVADHPTVEAAVATMTTAKRAGVAAVVGGVADAFSDPSAAFDHAQEIVSKARAARDLWGSAGEIVGPIAGWIAAHPSAVVAAVVAGLCVVMVVRSNATIAAVVERYRAGLDMG